MFLQISLTSGYMEDSWISVSASALSVYVLLLDYVYADMLF